MEHFINTVFEYNGHPTQQQINFFQKNGYIHFRRFLDPVTLALILDEVDTVEQFLLRYKIEKVNGIPLKFGTNTDGSVMIQRIAFASRHSHMLSGLLNSERIGTLTAFLPDYEARIGESEKDGLVVNHYLNTAGSAFNRIGWHTDSPRDLFLGSRIMPMLNVGLHLDDCPKTNGGLRVLAGTHKQGLVKLLFRKKYFIDNTADRREVGFDIQAGDLTIHDGRLWHRVEQSPYIGEASRRRVMYIPVVTGTYRPKNPASKTPFYHRIAGFFSKSFHAGQSRSIDTPQQKSIRA